MVRFIRIGCGAGFSGDRIEPAVDLARLGDLDYIVFECLAERTIALAHLRKLVDPNFGYDPLLERRLKEVLIPCSENKTKIITNMGAANPVSAAKKVLDLIKELDLSHIKVGVVLGDDILESLISSDFSILKDGREIQNIKDRIISANVYLGASPIINLLDQGADIIVTGRTCDSSLFLAPMMHELKWNNNDWDKTAFGVAVAHLMECGAQVTGGFFSDPGYKDENGLANLGFPIAEIFENREAIITKLENAGGEVSLRTVKEQLLYEVDDPCNYITADCVTDFTGIELDEIEKDRVRIMGGRGKPQPDHLKVSIGYNNGYLGEAQISYGGYNAKSRGELAAKILKERLRKIDLELQDLRFDFIGRDSLWPSNQNPSISNEVRLRVIGRTQKREDAEYLCWEVEALYTNGPAGGGGVTWKIEENISIMSSFIKRDNVSPQTKIMEVENG